MKHVKELLKKYIEADNQILEERDAFVTYPELIDELQEAIEQDEKENGWIPVSERLPDGGDCRYFMCLLENHLEDVPIFLQYNESVGFGFYTDIYDPVTLGFVDTEFSAVKELGYEEVLYWRELLNPPEED